VFSLLREHLKSTTPVPIWKEYILKKIFFMLVFATLCGVFAAQATAYQAVTGPRMDAVFSLRGQVYTLHLKVTATRDQREPGGWVRISTCGNSVPTVLHLQGTPWTKTKVMYWKFQSVPARSKGHLAKTYKFVLPQEGADNMKTCLRLDEHVDTYKSNGSVYLISN